MWKFPWRSESLTIMSLGLWVLVAVQRQKHKTRYIIYYACPFLLLVNRIREIAKKENKVENLLIFQNNIYVCTYV